MVGHSTLQKAQRILSSKFFSNQLLLAVMTTIILSIIIDLSFLKSYDLTQIDLEDQMLVFTCVSSVFVVAQIIVLRYIAKQNVEFVRTKQFQIIHYSVTVSQWVLTIIILYVIFQIWFDSSFDAIPITVGISISYSIGMIMTGYLSYRFLIWLKSNPGIKILMYLFSSALITTSAFLTLIFLNAVFSNYTEVTPRTIGTGQYLTAFQSISLMLANIFAIMSFVVTWVATAVLLNYRSRQIGRIKYWVIIALPLVYFLSQFISSITDEFAPLISSDPVTFAIVLTLIFTLSKLAGGILFGLAFWSIAKTINDAFVVPKNLIKLAGYGFVILFMSAQTVAFSIVPYPPFGFVTILFYGISSYMILVGVYFSVVVISQDSKLRSTIRKITEDEPALLADIAYAQVEDVIEKRVMRLVQRFATEPSSSQSTEMLRGVDIKNYAISVITEVRSYNLFYSKIMEKERDILSRSELFSACVEGTLLGFIRDDQFTLFRNIMDKHRTGTHKGIRLITLIDHTIGGVVEEFLSMGVEVKHISASNFKQFVVSDRALFEIPDTGKALGQRLLIEGDMTLVKHYLDIFERLWQSASDARERIEELKSNSTS